MPGLRVKLTFLSDYILKHTYDANLNIGLLFQESTEAFEASTSNFDMNKKMYIFNYFFQF